MKTIGTIFLLLMWVAATPAAERRLNNLVMEVANVSGAAANKVESIPFQQPADGWVYLSARSGGGSVALRFDDEKDERLGIALNEATPKGERQSYLKAGDHVLQVERGPKGQLDFVILRRVPEMTFSKFGPTPRTLSAGTYDWNFYAKYLLPHVNTIVGMENAAQLPNIQQWKARGGRWFVETPRSADPGEILKRFAMQTPDVDGVMVDEFSWKVPGVEAWLKGFGDSKEGRLYFADNFGRGDAFIKTALDAGRKIVWEKYIPEFPVEMNDQERLEAELSVWMRELRNDFPAAATNVYLCLGFFSAPSLTLNRSPDVDFKVWMDRQFQMVAIDPAFRGLPGLMEYQTRYADEETIRWAGLLFRHYGLEGKTNLLSEDYGFKYRLPHIANGDFLKDTAGWTVRPVDALVKVEPITRLAQYQGRFPYSNYWDRALAVTAKEAPVELRQRVKDLKAGRLYSAKLMSIRKEDIADAKSEQAKHPIELTIDGAALVAGAGSRDMIACPPSGSRPPFTGENPLWLDYRQVVFKAEAATADLKIVVSKSPSTYLIDFVEVQPYLPRE